MPSLTPNFNLPYPAPGDNPCDFAEQWCEFTDAITARMAVFQAGANRTIPLIPIAMLRVTSPVSVGGGNPIPFDTVTIDTAGMTNIDVDPYTITITRPGRYSIGAWISMDTIGAPFVTAEISITVAPHNDANAETTDRGAVGSGYFMTGYTPASSYVIGDKCRMSYNYGSVNAFPVNEAWMSVFWHADSGS